MSSTFTARIAVVTALAVLGAALASCRAELDEGCIGGACGGAAPGTAGPGGGAGSGEDGGAIDAAPCENAKPAGDFPPAVAKALVNCQRCHVPADQHPAAQGPFELLRYEDVKGRYGGTEIWSRMARVIREGTMPSAPPKLAPADERALLDWLDACAPPAPEGEGCDVGEGCAP